MCFLGYIPVLSIGMLERQAVGCAVFILSQAMLVCVRVTCSSVFGVYFGIHTGFISRYVRATSCRLCGFICIVRPC